jgi:outer membrane protein OmpA-like peptidoglycan-associated protein
VRNLTHQLMRIAGAFGVAAVLGGCGLSSVGGPPGAPAVMITQDVAPSMLLTVTNGLAAGRALTGLVVATARPNEDIRIMRAGMPATTIVAADSPTPATIVMPGPPAAPGSGQTAYQSAQYARKLKVWQAKRAAEVQAKAAKTRGQVSAWLDGLQIPQKIRQLVDPPANEGSLASEGAAAASAQVDLAQGEDGVFGSRRVIVLFCDELGGALPAGELTGDDVIAVTNYLPTAAASSAAQAALLAAGATQAAVLGPEVTASRMAALVTAGLSQGVEPRDSTSEPVLFGNDSYTLSPAAVRELTKTLPQLREPGATAVISGFASTPGTVEANYLLSYQRATAVAQFFEAHGIPASSLIIVGHGATDLVGSGTSGTNRRVLVVIEEPAG